MRLGAREKTYIALLRGINVTGYGILAMKDLAVLCSGLGFASVRTYIQSGNVVFRSMLSEQSVRARLEHALASLMGKKVAVMVRTADELARVLKANPFAEFDCARVGVHFLQEAPATDFLEHVVAPGGEQVRLGAREVYVYFPDGMGATKLKLPLKGDVVTVRNINTVRKLVEMAREADEIS